MLGIMSLLIFIDPHLKQSTTLPYSMNSFFTLLNKLSNLRHPSYICGDFNINLLKINVKAHYNNFFENTLSSGFFPKITLPTRISETCSTLIDNILTNVIESNGVKLVY